jgi:NAD(P)-dependent dehydrogenase (short-subunit alcohol dehydrogenase family)
MVQNKIVLITGATGGMGKETALALAKEGYTVVLHGRNLEKTLDVSKEIQCLSGNRNVDIIIGNLFSLKDVRQIADDFKKKYAKLDILINNAGGIMDKNRAVTEDCVEKTLAINTVAPFLLTYSLLGYLHKSENGRIINYSSDAHKLSAKPDFSDIELEEGYTPLRAYGNSKLFVIWITRHLAKKLEDVPNNKVTVNSLHPGAVATGFGVGTDLGWFMNFVSKIFRPFQKTARQGAETAIYLAQSSEVNSVTGKYFVNKKIAKVSERYYSEKHEKIIWNYCKEKITKWIDN